tara:strand:+ start:4594 stop:5304 length:711 start_codon:yes stop_codon:yes gene_type:complete
MAISVDTVYQRVLAIANKEQRGYITPQEFNLLANQAQTEIFESYFYDKNQRERLEPDEKEYSETSISKLLERKLAPFTTVAAVIGGTTYPSHYQIGKIFLDNQECVKMDRNELKSYKFSARHQTISITNLSAVYIDSETNGHDIEVYKFDGSSAKESTGVTCEVINAPAAVEWAYVVVNEKALYNASAATDFTLHISEENTLVNRILELAGIILNKPGLVNLATSRTQAELQTQKQ